MTTCPSGVNYMHLVDHAREHIEKTYKRPLGDRLIRGLLARVLPDPALFRLAVVAGLIAKPFAPVLHAFGFKRLAAMARITPGRIPAAPSGGVRKVYPAAGERRGRVALLAGCINPVLAPSTNEAAIRRAQPARYRGGGGARAKPAAARSPITWGASARRSQARATTSTPGRAKWRGRGWTPSSSRCPAAARR